MGYKLRQYEIHTFVTIERNSVCVCMHRDIQTGNTLCISLHESVCVLYVCMYVCISLCVFRELENWVESGEQVWKDDQSKVFKKMP